MNLFEVIFSILLILIFILFSIGFYAKSKSQPKIQFVGLSGHRILILVLLLLVTIIPGIFLSFDWLAGVRTFFSFLTIIVIALVVKEGMSEDGIYSMRTYTKWEDVTKYAVYKKSFISTKIYVQTKSTEAQIKEANVKGEKPEINWFNFHFSKSNRKAIVEHLSKKLQKKLYKS